MPTWLTIAELRARRGPEIDRLASDGGVVSESRIGTAIDTGEAIARSYLVSRYGESLPSSPETTPEALKEAVAPLAHYALLGGRPTKAQDWPAHLELLNSDKAGEPVAVDGMPGEDPADPATWLPIRVASPSRPTR